MNAVSIEHINDAIMKLSKFITPMIPLASCHMVDYITAKHWETLLPEKIQKDLLNVPRDQLQHLPSASLTFNDTDTCSKSCEWSLSSSDLPSFLVAIRQHSLPSLEVITTVDEILTAYGSEEVFTPSMKGVMSDKKSHEVEVMSQVIARFAKGCGVDWVFDIGSGKGYLSTALVLQYGLNVIAIDSSSTNTSSAVSRKTKLQKYWKHIKRIERDRALGKPVKKGKHWRRLKSSTSAADNEATDSPASLNDKNIGRHIAVTAYVSDDTDLLQVVRDCTSDEKDNVIDSTNESASSTLTEKGEASNQNGFYEENIKQAEATNTVCNGDDEEHNLDKADLTDMQHETNLKDPKVNLKADVKDGIRDFEENFDAKAADAKACINIQPEIQLGLVGLHTCGNLAPSSLRIYSANPRVKFLCNIGCCYHLLEEEFSRNPFLDCGKENQCTSSKSDRLELRDANHLSQEKYSMKQVSDVNIMHPSEIPDLNPGFPLCQTLKDAEFSVGRNSRMLSCQPADRLNYKDLSSTVALYWRALLRVILLEKVGSDAAHVGRIASKCQNFSEYARTAFNKLNLDIEIGDEELQEYNDKYSEHLGKLERFFFLRASLAPVIEGLILLDRLAYLYEQDIGPSYLVQLFDPVTSPRSHAIIAFRK